MVYVCSDMSVADTKNGSVDFSQTKRTIALVGFYGDLFNKSIQIGSATTAIDLPIFTIIDNLNKTPLLPGGTKSLL